ncbi:MAG: magnesium transporter CorA family protein [Anaerolineales bacterium]|nr:magnesium transporter CorA family protein [Anaerolineales bacterium]
MIRSLYYSPDGKIRTDISQGELILLKQTEGGVLWIDMVGEDKPLYKLVLEEIFDFHPLSVDDALEQTHVPKVDDWGKYLYLVLNDLEISSEPGELIELKELDVFVGEGFLVTYHPRQIGALDRIWESCQWDPHYLKRGAFNLFYHLADLMVEGHLPVFDQIESQINDLEDQILSAQREDTLELIFVLKRDLQKLRRIITPQREVFYKLSHNDFYALELEQRYFFRNIYEHYVLLNEMSESLRELVSSSLEIYLSAANNQMNQVVKVLTIITTIFMPMTVITGLFGMNFFQLEFSVFTTLGKVGLALALLILVSVPVAMILWMRSRKWI